MKSAQEIILTIKNFKVEDEKLDSNGSFANSITSRKSI